MQLETYHFNTSIKGKNVYTYESWKNINLCMDHDNLMGWVPWMSYFQPDACGVTKWCWRNKGLGYGQITEILAANFNLISVRYKWEKYLVLR